MERVPNLVDRQRFGHGIGAETNDGCDALSFQKLAIYLQRSLVISEAKKLDASDSITKPKKLLGGMVVVFTAIMSLPCPGSVSSGAGHRTTV